MDPKVKKSIIEEKSFSKPVGPGKEFNSKEIKFTDLRPTGTSETVDHAGKFDRPVHKKRGRPRKVEKEAETQEEVLKISEDIFSPVFSLLNKILIARYGPVVRLEDDEITSLKFYLALVANKYLPSVVQRFGVEFTLGILVFTIAADKTIKYQAWKSRQEVKPDIAAQPDIDLEIKSN